MWEVDTAYLLYNNNIFYKTMYTFKNCHCIKNNSD